MTWKIKNISTTKWTWSQRKDDPKNEDNLKSEYNNNLKKGDNLKNEDNQENGDIKCHHLKQN